MMQDRQIVALYVSRINRIITKLDYVMNLRESFSLSAIDPTFTKIGEWAQEIKIYWDDTHSKEIGAEILKIGSSANLYKMLLSYKMPDDLRGSISLYIDTMKDLRAAIDKQSTQNKGEFALLPDAIANKEAANLLGRAVSAGFLDQKYQPSEQTKPFQVMLLAKCIGNILKIKPLWTPFEQLWNQYGKLSGIIPPITDMESQKAITGLYPEINLDRLESIKKHKYFNTKGNTTEKDLVSMFDQLKRFEYIDNSTDHVQWTYLFKATEADKFKPIIWLREQSKLALFIDQTFGFYNASDLWKITEYCFIIQHKDGTRHKPHIPSMISGVAKKREDKNKGRLMDDIFKEIDYILYRISKGIEIEG